MFLFYWRKLFKYHLFARLLKRRWIWEFRSENKPQWYDLACRKWINNRRSNLNITNCVDSWTQLKDMTHKASRSTFEYHLLFLDEKLDRTNSGTPSMDYITRLKIPTTGRTTPWTLPLMLAPSMDDLFTQAYTRLIVPSGHPLRLRKASINWIFEG